MKLVFVILSRRSLMALHALPAVYVHHLGEDMRFFTDNKMLFARFDCNFHHWATNGLNYYVLAKLLWNPYRDVDELVEDYCAIGFGPAAEAVHRYFEEIERITAAIAEERQRPTSDTITCHYTDETLAKLHGILDEAEQAAGYDAWSKSASRSSGEGSSMLRFVGIISLVLQRTRTSRAAEVAVVVILMLKED